MSFHNFGYTNFALRSESLLQGPAHVSKELLPGYKIIDHNIDITSSSSGNIDFCYGYKVNCIVRDI